MTLKYFRFTTLITMASSRGGYIAYGLFIKAPRGWGVFLLPFLVVGGTNGHEHIGAHIQQIYISAPRGSIYKAYAISQDH